MLRARGIADDQLLALVQILGEALVGCDDAPEGGGGGCHRFVEVFFGVQAFGSSVAATATRRNLAIFLATTRARLQTRPGLSYDLLKYPKVAHSVSAIRRIAVFAVGRVRMPKKNFRQPLGRS